MAKYLSAEDEFQRADIFKEKSVNQQFRLYAWEDLRVLTLAMFSFKKSVYASNEELEALADQIAKDYKIKRPDIVFEKKMDSFAGYYRPDTHSIHLKDESVMPRRFILVHEFAHAIQEVYHRGGGNTHDQFFTGIACNMYARYFDMEEEDLIQSARHSGLLWASLISPLIAFPIWPFLGAFWAIAAGLTAFVTIGIFVPSLKVTRFSFFEEQSGLQTRSFPTRTGHHSELMAVASI